MDEIKKKVVAVYNGNVMAFNYQSTSCEEIEITEDYPIEWESEDIFFHNINRFYVEGGVVKRRTDEECIAYNPDAYKEVKDREKKLRYEAETDKDMYAIIEKLALKFEAEIPEVKEWLESKTKIRDEEC